MVFIEPYHGRIIQFSEVILAHHVQKGLKEIVEESQLPTWAVLRLAPTPNNLT